MSDADSEKVADLPLAVTINNRAEAYSGFRHVHVYQYTEDQSQLQARREIVAAKDAVAVVAHDPVQDKLVMIRQFRLGAQLGTGRGMSVELAAGLIDEGEDAITAAGRELMEETGLAAKRLLPMCQFLTTPGITDEVLHIFYAEVDASNLTQQAGEAGETEQTFPFLVDLDEAMAAVDGNAIYNGIVMIGLMWFARHRAQIVGNVL